MQPAATRSSSGRGAALPPGPDRAEAAVQGGGGGGAAQDAEATLSAAECDVALLDDPLSAVDPQVGEVYPAATMLPCNRSNPRASLSLPTIPLLVRDVPYRLPS